MKLLFLAALVATGACRSWWSTSEDNGGRASTQHNKFSSSKEYVYDYESQVMTGIPRLSKQYSGIKITSKAKIAFGSASDATLQLDEVQVYTMNHEIQNPQQLPVRQQISIDQFSPLSSEQARLVVERLQRPIKFRYQSGKIEQLEVCDEESNWSVDLKRSILSMLQVRLQASDFSVTQNLEYNNLEKENSTSFDVLEKGLDGECYSSIHVQQSSNSTTQFQVTKSRDESRCLSLNRQRKDVQPHQQRNCECQDNMNKMSCECRPDQEERRQQEETETRTTYDISSDNRQDILIHKAVQTVQYRYQTPNAPNQYSLTTSNQTLNLIEERDQETISSSGCNFQTVSQPWKQQVLSQSQEKPMMSEEQRDQQIRDTLSEMETITSDPQRYDDHTVVFHQLISQLSQCKESQLEQIYTECRGQDNSSNNRKWKVLVDAMSFSNNTNSACSKVLLKKIKQSDIQGLEANSVLAVMSADQVPSTETIDYMLNVLLPTLQSNSNRRSTYKHAMLSFASMVRRYIDQQQRQKFEAVQESQKTHHQSNIDNCRKYQKYVEGRLSAANNEQDKVLCLKAISNMGDIQAIQLVQKHLQRSEKKAVRIQAIQAFQHFGQQNQIQTLQSLLPLMNNQQEDSEIRVAAFLMVMRCDPSSSLLSVQKQIRSEQDNEYKTVVIQHLKNCLHRREPGFQQRNSKIRSILRNVPAFLASQQSRDLETAMGLYGDEMNGDVVVQRSLFNQTSKYPRSGSYQQLSLSNGVRRQIAEFGFRTEGMDQLIQKLTNRGNSANSNSHADLRALDKLQSQKNQEQPKPSVTIYVKVMGQEISYIHLDESAISSMLSQGLKTNTDGYVQIPVKFFQTFYFKPYQMAKLQPNGMWQHDETVYSGVMDIDGQIKIRMSKGQMPSITFGTTKPVRVETKTILSQYVDAGFALSGAVASLTSRRTAHSSNMTVSYLPAEGKLVLNHTQPQQNNDLATQELRGELNSFVMPMRLPQIVKSRNQCDKEMKSQDSQRQQFTQQIQSLKSVELNAKVEVDADMPRLYNFLAERWNTFPTSLSTRRQVVKFSVKPDTSSQRNFTLSCGGRFFQSSELEQMEAQNWNQQQQGQRQSQRQQSQQRSLMSLLWGSDDQDEQSQPQPISTQQFLQSDSLGSLYYFQYFTLSSESHNQVRNMTGNMTTYYEHNYPTTRSLIRFQRPPVPSSQEREPVEFTNKMVSTVNPGNNEFIWANNMSWGERTHGQRSNLTWTIRLTPDYKDGVCYSQNVEGCRDQYGVSYPVNYNVTHQFSFNHTDIVERYLNFSSPSFVSNAQSLFAEPLFNQQPQQSQQHGRFNISQTIRPSSNRFDVKFPMSPRHPVCIEMNATNIYSPMEVNFWKWMSQNQYPVSQIKNIHDFLPQHNRVNPFQSRRDMCVIQAPKSFTFGRQEVTMPKTDCEVILAGDCRSSNKQLLVSIMPASNQGKSAERELKTVVGSNKIQIVFTPRSSFNSQQMKVKVNNVERQLNQDNQVVVEESSMPVAVVQCDKKRCEILSQKYGVYVSINSERVTVEVNSEKSHQMCGLCSGNPEMRHQQQLNSTESLNWWKQNQVQNSQCTTEEPSRQQQQETCNQQYKHKVKSTVDENGRMQTCVSVNRLPVCSSRCNQKSIRTNSEQFRCVSQQQAQQLEITPRIEGEDLVLDDERILRRFQNAKQIQSNVNIAMSCRN